MKKNLLILILCSCFSFLGIEANAQCNEFNRGVKISHWSPEKGSVAEFVEGELTAPLDTAVAWSFLIFIGSDAQGVWSVYGSEDDSSSTMSLHYKPFSKVSTTGSSVRELVFNFFRNG